MAIIRDTTGTACAQQPGSDTAPLSRPRAEASCHGLVPKLLPAMPGPHGASQPRDGLVPVEDSGLVPGAQDQLLECCPTWAFQDFVVGFSRGATVGDVVAVASSE